VRHVRASVRLRLTALYALLFLGAGAVLLGLTYGLVTRALAERFRVVITSQRSVPATSFQRYVSGADAYVQHLQNAVLHDLLVQSSIALGLTTVLIVGLGWVMAGRALRPLEMAFESQHRFVANASHELRTPLAVQRTLIDVALRDPDIPTDDLRATLRQLRDVVDLNHRLIDGLLLLARPDRGLEDAEPVDLAAETARVIEHTRGEAGERCVAIRSCLGRAMVPGDRALLRRLVENLVENAVRHNVAHGWVEVSLGGEGPAAVLRVANGGEVIPEAEVPSLFEPFRRLRRERTEGAGVGLGLSIVQAVTRAHGGSVSARAPAEGGLEVTVRLPG
jgi:signal transduction histidine kinase